jgi:membrane-bound lytic murein transglycosylase MltF
METLAEPEFNASDEVIGLSEKWTGDLDGMIERGRIRALVPYNRTSYFIDGMKRSGITFEALNLFEQKFNERLGKKSGNPGYVQVIFIPMTRDRILSSLQEGYGDIAAANLVITDNRKDLIDFSAPLLSNWNELVVSGPEVPPLSSLEDLLGDTVHVRRSSSYFEHLEMLNDSLRTTGKPIIHIEPVDEFLEDDDILEMVNAGLIPLTIVNEFTVKLWEPVLKDIRVHPNLMLKTDGEVAWAMRKNSPKLKAVVDVFVQENKQGTLMGNLLLKRYLNNLSYAQKASSPETLNRFIMVRDLFVKYGKQYDIDWLLLAAQGYQESQLDNSKQSSAGAVGIMQIKPSTAADPNVGIDNVYDMENNIHAGTKYLAFIRERYFTDPKIDPLNAILFSMAAYNMGPARINRIRGKADGQGVNPNIWFGEVELLVAREVGQEPVQYVSNIYKYYASFRSLRRYGEKTGKTVK